MWDVFYSAVELTAGDVTASPPPRPRARVSPSQPRRQVTYTATNLRLFSPFYTSTKFKQNYRTPLFIYTTRKSLRKRSAKILQTSRGKLQTAQGEIALGRYSLVIAPYPTWSVYMCLSVLRIRRYSALLCNKVDKPKINREVRAYCDIFLLHADDPAERMKNRFICSQVNTIFEPTNFHVQ